MPHSRKKLEMTRRLDFFFNKLEANPTATPLATDYIRDDQDLSESDGEEGNDEDPKTQNKRRSHRLKDGYYRP
jgi:hypothetical protein